MRVMRRRFYSTVLTALTWPFILCTGWERQAILSKLVERHVRSLRTGNPSDANSINASINSLVSPTMVSSTLTTPLPDEPDVGQKWLIYVSAVPTVLVFIICVIFIAIKNRYEENHVKTNDSPDVTDGLLALAKSASSPKKRKKSKHQKFNQKIYDDMLAKFKAERNKKTSVVGRKSSQIRIEGMASRSPKSLARKHILIGKLNQEDLAPDDESSALGQLVQLSTHTFIGTSLIEQMEDEGEWESDKDHIRNLLRKSCEDISEARKILPYDVTEELLPEDLEEAFRNFGNWEESLI